MKKSHERWIVFGKDKDGNNITVSSPNSYVPPGVLKDFARPYIRGDIRLKKVKNKK